MLLRLIRTRQDHFIYPYHDVLRVSLVDPIDFGTI